ncbi:MAG: putative S-layer protein [Nanoarchaeota archaeon]
MNISKLISLFAFVALAVLSLGFASAQASNCITLQSSSLPFSVVNNQGTFTATFVLNNTGNPCTVGTVARNITSINFNSTLGSNNVSSSWTLNTVLVNPPISIAVGQLSTFTATFNIPAGSSGTLSNSIIVSTVTQAGRSDAGSPYTFTLPSVTITQPVSNLTISASTGPFRTNQNVTLTVTNTGNTILNSIIMSEITTPSLFGVTFNPNTAFSLNTGNSSTVTAILNSLTGLKFGLNIVNVQASTGTGTNSQTATTSFQVKKTFCSAGETVTSNLTIANIDWSNNGEGDDDSWELLDEVEVEVKVENHNQDDDVDATIELGLYDSSGNNQADNLVFLADSDGEDEQIDININDDDDETVTFKFKVPADFDTGNYKLTVKVFDDDAGESRSCRDSSNDFTENSFFKTIDVKQTSDEGKYVVVDEISMDSQVACGQAVSGQFTVFNVGKDEQDRVKITIRNKDLGISQTKEITKLDQGDDETLDFTISIPATAENGNYPLEFITEYDYKNGVYREESDDSFDYIFEVLGCSQNLKNPGSGALTNIEIDAKLDSDAKAGKELIVTATIKNTGTEDATYSLSAKGYSTWAELTDISDETISVDAGESKEVTFTLLVNEDSVGTQAFDIQVASQDKVLIQEVEVKLSEGLKLPSFGSPLIWVIVLVNIVLIALIIVVAVKLSKR